MGQISSHNFSSSPVTEVLCSFRDLKSQRPNILTVPSPYPGWDTIRRQVNSLLGSVGSPDSGTISDCILRYSDHFDLLNEDDPAVLFSIAPRVRAYPVGYAVTELGISSAVPDSNAEIRYKQDGGKVEITFTVRSDPSRYFNSDTAIEWFDKAHEEIHLLFDEVISDIILSRIR